MKNANFFLPLSCTFKKCLIWWFMIDDSHICWFFTAACFFITLVGHFFLTMEFMGYCINSLYKKRLLLFYINMNPEPVVIYCMCWTEPKLFSSVMKNTGLASFLNTSVNLYCWLPSPSVTPVWDDFWPLWKSDRDLGQLLILTSDEQLCVSVLFLVFFFSCNFNHVS